MTKGTTMTITAALVKQLRDLTGAGMMDCKKALTETDGDLDAAVDWLRTKGIAKAEKKSGRTAAEGLIGVAASGADAVVVEVNSETDFVARNDAFQTLVGDVAQVALGTDGSVEAVAAATRSTLSSLPTATGQTPQLGQQALRLLQQAHTIMTG